MENGVSRFALSIAAACVFIIALSQPNKSQTTPPTPPATKKAEAQSTPSQEIDPDDVIRINTTLVNSPVLVIGRDGKFVPNLRREDFKIFEDGVQQEISYFSTVDKPFTVALLIDTSRSTFLDLEDIKDAALSFVDKMRPNDRALIISFSGEIKVLAEPTSDRETLKRAINNCRPEGNSRVYDAISFALADRLDRIAGRTAVILFSDGVDNDSREATYESTLQRIQRTQALIYPVQFSTYDYMERGSTSRSRKAPEGSGFSRQDYVRADAYLHQAAALSGTGVYPAQNISDLAYAIANIVDELHNEYSIGYYPRDSLQADKQRRVEVQTRLPQLVVRARTSYSRDPTGALLRMTTGGNSTPPSAAEVTGATPLRRNLEETKSARDERWLCKSTDAPTDFVVVKEGFVSYCPRSTRPNDETNAWLIRRPAPREIMCKGFMMWRGRELPGAPIPTGYVVTSEATSPVCSKSNDPKNSANAWVIHKPTGRDTVCKGFPLPRGYVMAGEEFVAGCPAKPFGKNAWIIRPK